MVYGSARGPPVDESDLTAFAGELSSLPAEEWQRRVSALKTLVGSVPDYSTAPPDDNGEYDTSDYEDQLTPLKHDGEDKNDNQSVIPWYRSYKSVRHLAPPLKTLLLDARSAVVKEATELIGTLMMVKLQPHPSLTNVSKDSGKDTRDGDENDKSGGFEMINGSFHADKKVRYPLPPPAFVGRLLLKDLLPAILDLSKQTVKVIRTYGVTMTVDILPHCRVKSSIVLLLERMKTHQHRTVREDCARYLRCVLETWPWDPTGSCDNISNDDVVVVNSRKEERLSLDSTRQIGLGLGRTLSDSAKPVREEAKRGFQVVYRRFRPIWDEVMSSGVVRDVRLRKKLLEVASRLDVDGDESNLFDDATSLGETSLNSAFSSLSFTSNKSYMSHRSYVSRGTISNGVPSMIGTPKVSPRVRPRSLYSPSSSPGYTRNTGSSSVRVALNLGACQDQPKVHAKESSRTFSTNNYVTSSGHMLSTPSPRKGRAMYGGTPQQPFASLLQTPGRPTVHQQSPVSQKMFCKALKRLSRWISGIEAEAGDRHQSSAHNLSSIDEAGDGGSFGSPLSATEDAQFSERTRVAMELIAVHLSHLDQIQLLVSKEKELLLDLTKRLGAPVTNEANTVELTRHLASRLSEKQVCNYFELVHECVDSQREAIESLLEKMECISKGVEFSIVSGIESPAELHRGQDAAQSPLDVPDLASMQRDLKDEFIASS